MNRRREVVDTGRNGVGHDRSPCIIRTPGSAGPARSRGPARAHGTPGGRSGRGIRAARLTAGARGDQLHAARGARPRRDRPFRRAA
ncbi:hypothetical protein UK82_02415 [Frankia sp. ACN1ag]|nr:hypothetical protein UK82_02415 [Frankia sp. ACN1ag]